MQKKEPRPIDANEVQERLLKICDSKRWKQFDVLTVLAIAEFVADPESFSTIDPVKRGHWLFDKEVSFLWLCSSCGKSPSVNGNGTGIGYIQRASELFGFCPHCGAKMDEVKNEND